jgi:hypothetical protein
MNKDDNKKVVCLCESCDLRIETDEEPDMKPSCPVCQKPVFRIREIVVSDLVESKDLGEFIDLKCKNNEYPSKKKLRRHTQTGVRRGADGRLVNVRRFINAETKQYEEAIIDLETGKVIRDCKEPLSAHRGRGSERKKK